MAYLNWDEMMRKAGEAAPPRPPLDLQEPAPPANASAGATPTAVPEPAGAAAPSVAAYFNANRDAAGAMADQMASGLQTRAQDAIKAGDVGGALDVKQDLSLAQTQEGRQALFQENADPTYTQGMAGLDAYMVGRSGRDPAFADLAAYFSPTLDQVGIPPADPTAPAPIPGEPRRDPPERTIDDTFAGSGSTGTTDTGTGSHRRSRGRDDDRPSRR